MGRATRGRALVGRARPGLAGDPIASIQACNPPSDRPPGRDRVDLASALEALHHEAGVEVVRVDSGGGLTGVLLKEHLLDEVSLLVHPYLAGARGDRFWYGTERRESMKLELMASKSFDGGLVWLRHRISEHK